MKAVYSLFINGKTLAPGLAVFLLFGCGAENRDSVKPFDPLEESLRDAGTGNAVAQYELGSHYYFGSGSSSEYEDAAKWFHLAASQGHAGAQLYLGRLYDSGQGVTQDKAEALKFYSLAAEQGNSAAQYKLGMKYDLGQGVPQDFDKALTWLLKAAEQGHGDAQLILGIKYEDDDHGVAMDRSEAIKWFRKAADQGATYPQIFLGKMYAAGRDVEQDIVEAYKYFSVAARAGSEEPVQLRNALAPQLTSEQIAEAERRVAEFPSLNGGRGAD